MLRWRIWALGLSALLAAGAAGAGAEPTHDVTIRINVDGNKCIKKIKGASEPEIRCDSSTGYKEWCRNQGGAAPQIRFDTDEEYWEGYVWSILAKKGSDPVGVQGFKQKKLPKTRVATIKKSIDGDPPVGWEYSILAEPASGVENPDNCKKAYLDPQIIFNGGGKRFRVLFWLGLSAAVVVLLAVGYWVRRRWMRPHVGG